MTTYRPFADNNDGAYDLFRSRVLFKYYAYYGFPQDLDNVPLANPAGIKDYWLQGNVLYGKVDRNFVEMQVKKQFLVPIEGDNGIFYALDFVAAAFKDFQESFKIPLREGRLQNNTRLSDPQPVKGYEDAESMYEDHIIQVVSNFNKFLLTTRKSYDIFDAKDYTKAFMKYYFDSNEVRYLTKSSYMLSPNVSNRCGGMTIEIADLPYGNDIEKSSFVESLNFDFYRQAAINHGFHIDKNIPWRMNIDLSSPALKKYVDFTPTPVVDTATAVFTEYFTNSYLDDLTILQDYILSGYNDLASKERKFKVGACYYYRNVTDNSAYSDSFEGSYFIDKYALIKNKEKGQIFNKVEMDIIRSNSNQYYSLGRVNSALKYINRKFRAPFLYPGSMFYDKLKREFVESGEISLDKFSEYVKMISKELAFSLY